jgi:hypothetical protein
MTGFGYNVSGFGASAAAGSLGVATSLGFYGASGAWDALDIKAGDLCVLMKSQYVGGASFSTTNGFTNIAVMGSSTPWSSPYYEGVALYYKILDGTESQPSGSQWIVIRYGTAVSSVSVSNIAYSGNASLTYNFNASDSESVVRVICSGGYTINDSQRNAWSGSNEITADNGYNQGAGLMVTTTQDSGTLQCSGGTFNRAALAATITPSA